MKYGLSSRVLKCLVFLVVLGLSIGVQDQDSKTAIANPVSKVKVGHRGYLKNLKSIKVSPKVDKMPLMKKAIEMVKSGNQKIVLFKNKKLSWSKKEAQVTRSGGHIVRRLSNGGIVAYFPKKSGVSKIKSNSRVRKVVKDELIDLHFAGCADSDSCGALGELKGSERSSLAQTVWNIKRASAPEVWDVTSGCEVKVCVVDTGIDRTHPDLKSRDRGGINLMAQTEEEDGQYDDLAGHGSHVSGIIGAAQNGKGIVGMAPNVGIYTANVFGGGFTTATSTVIEGVEYCREIEADVINMSLGGGSYNEAFEESIKGAIDEGITVVASAGNNGCGEDYDPNDPLDNVSYPAKYKGVIAVSASDGFNKHAAFSSQGPDVDIMAPGTTGFTWENCGGWFKSAAYDLGIYSAVAGDAQKLEVWPGDEAGVIDGVKRYGRMSGTSMSAPMVVGAVALMKSFFGTPDQTRAQKIALSKKVEAALLAGAKDVGLHKNKQGAGLLDVAGAFNKME